MKRYQAYIFDLDGTLYRGSEVIPDAPEVVNHLRAQGAAIRYLTNNSTQTRDHFVDKLSGMGFEVHPEEVMSSSIGTARYLTAHNLTRVFAVGMPGLVRTLREAGISVLNADDEGRVQPEELVCDAVVVGLCSTFTYDLMRSAMQPLLRGTPFVATNPDTTFPLEGGRLVPGAGSIVAGIAACSGRNPFVVGKPNPFLIELILREGGFSAADTLVVGDRTDTDIASGIGAGCPTHLVLTGVESASPEGQSFSPTLAALLD